MLTVGFTETVNGGFTDCIRCSPSHSGTFDVTAFVADLAIFGPYLAIVRSRSSCLRRFDTSSEAANNPPQSCSVSNP